MKIQVVGWRRFLRLASFVVFPVMAALVLGATAWATPPLGFIVNETLASGVAVRRISQHMQINRSPDGTVAPWQLQLQVQGDTDYYSHRIVLAPGGYSGWHSHPGVLIAAVKSGQIDFYNASCEKQTVGPGQVYTENDEVHAISNTGAVDADVYITFLVKHGAPRRIDEPAPDCAVYTGIP
jgi:quercetin dioxygenase-like cupin family protein